MSRIVILALAVFAAQGETLRVGIVAPQEIEQRLRSAPAKNQQRQQAIEQMFRDAGCEPELRRLGHSKFSNVVCTVPGASEEVIIVGGHFDHSAAGEGVIDNWSGATMVANMIQSLRTEARQHTFVFAAFAREEEGLLGAHSFAGQLKKPQLSHIRAMVNIDSLGLGAPVVWRSRANKELFSFAQATAGVLNMKLDVVDVDGAGDGDSAPFKEKKIPVIDFHSIRRETFHILHTKDDNIQAVQWQGYMDSFRLIANFLAYIDLKLP